MRFNDQPVITALVAERTLDSVRESLAPDGVEVLHAASLEEAVLSPALVILCDADTHAPWQRVLQQILESRPSARVVLLSRLADDRMWADILTYGAYDLLPKPFETREIRSVVLGALEPAAVRQPSRSEMAPAWAADRDARLLRQACSLVA